MINNFSFCRCSGDFYKRDSQSIIDICNRSSNCLQESLTFNKITSVKKVKLVSFNVIDLCNGTFPKRKNIFVYCEPIHNIQIILYIYYVYNNIYTNYIIYYMATPCPPC